MNIALHPAETFGERLFAALHSEASEFQQKELAAALGISQAAVSQRLSSGGTTIAKAEELLLAIEALRARAATKDNLSFSGRT